jgi:hypothetical protein
MAASDVPGATRSNASKYQIRRSSVTAARCAELARPALKAVAENLSVGRLRLFCLLAWGLGHYSAAFEPKVELR